MTAQLHLPLTAPVPEVTPSEVAALIDRLRGHGWQTARDLGAHRESDKRQLRAIANASAGHIISGQKGYKLTLEATLPEIDATVWLKHQGQEMIQRYAEIQRVRHQHHAPARP